MAKHKLQGTEWRPPHLRPSLYPEGPLTCAFGLDMAVDKELPAGLIPAPPELSRLTFKITQVPAPSCARPRAASRPAASRLSGVCVAQVGFRAVRDAFLSGGFVGLAKGMELNARWGKLKLGQYKGLKSYQRINHFPGTWQLGRKDNLSRNCARQVRPPQPPEPQESPSGGGF